MLAPAADISGNAPSPTLDLNDSSKGYAGYDFTILNPKSAAPAPSSSSGLYAAMGLSAIQAVASTWQGISAARGQRDIEQSVARTNALFAHLQATEALAQGDFALARKVQETEQTVGTLRARAGASGVDVNSGSNVLVRSAITGVGLQDTLTIKNNAARAAWGYETEAMTNDYRARVASLNEKAESEQSLVGGGIKAISGPLAIEQNYLRYARYMSGGGGGDGGRLPFNLSTN